jgi:hypothetical protein
MTDTQGMAEARRIIALRGYVKEVAPGRHVGVCLTLNLVVEASSQREALKQLHGLIGAYLEDALQNNELDAFVPRRAPARFYVEYWVGRIASRLHAVRQGFKAFKDCHTLPAHA